MVVSCFCLFAFCFCLLQKIHSADKSLRKCEKEKKLNRQGEPLHIKSSSAVLIKTSLAGGFCCYC